MGSEKHRVDLQSIKSDKVMDTRGLESPMPLLKTISALSCLGPEKILEVWCTDPESKTDIPEIDGKEGTYMGSLHDPDGYTRFFIQKIM
jgi:tRNA 2-thiouridine synthesizing protein A